MNDGLAEYYEAQIDAAQQVQAEKSARLMREIYGEDVLEMCAKRCNQHMHYCKGPTREQRDKAHDKRLVIDDTLTEHEKVAKLANLLEQARRDGARLEVEIPGAAWGDTLILPSGREDPKEKAGAHGVKHALEKRHQISSKEIAETLIKGDMTPSKHSDSRVEMRYYTFKVVLEREINRGSGHISTVTAKLHTAINEEE